MLLNELKSPILGRSLYYCTDEKSIASKIKKFGYQTLEEPYWIKLHYDNLLKRLSRRNKEEINIEIRDLDEKDSYNIANKMSGRIWDLFRRKYDGTLIWLMPDKPDKTSYGKYCFEVNLPQGSKSLLHDAGHGVNEIGILVHTKTPLTKDNFTIVP
jgi:hypothetical protein